MDNKENSKLAYLRMLINSNLLTKTEKKYLRMHFFGHEKQTEIARLCGVSVSSVSRGLSRAYKRIRPLLAAWEVGYDTAIKDERSEDYSFTQKYEKP